MTGLKCKLGLLCACDSNLLSAGGDALLIIRLNQPTSAT